MHKAAAQEEVLQLLVKDGLRAVPPLPDVVPSQAGGCCRVPRRQLPPDLLLQLCSAQRQLIGRAHNFPDGLNNGQRGEGGGSISVGRRSVREGLVSMIARCLRRILSP